MLIGSHKDFAYAPGAEIWARNVGMQVSLSRTTEPALPTGQRIYPSPLTSFVRGRSYKANIHPIESTSSRQKRKPYVLSLLLHSRLASAF